MLLWLSQIIGLIATPSALLTLLMVGATAGLYTRWRNAARIVLGISLASFAVACVGPLGAWLLRPLENRFPVLPVNAPAPAGVIVLGSPDETILARGGGYEINDAGGRMTAAVALLRRYPHAQLVVTGGSSDLPPSARTKGGPARVLLEELGVPPERIRFEDRSRDTYESAVFSKQLIRPQAGEDWLLVTSAAHMPRAVGAFRQVGFPATPAPVDFEVTPAMSVDDFAEPSRGLRRTDRAAREWLGLIFYGLTGRSASWFPGPSRADRLGTQ